MVNASLNWASIVGIVLAVGGALLYFMRSFKPALARDYDVFFAAVGLLCGGILFFQGWRLDPILQFGQFLLAGTTVFFAYESVRLRGVTTEQARRSSYFDDDEPAPAGPYRPRMGGSSWGERDVDRFDEPQPLRRRIPARDDEDDFYRPRSSSRAAIPERAASRRERFDRERADDDWTRPDAGAVADRGPEPGPIPDRGRYNAGPSRPQPEFGARRRERDGGAEPRRGSRPSASPEAMPRSSRRPAAASGGPGAIPQGTPIRGGSSSTVSDADFSPIRPAAGPASASAAASESQPGPANAPRPGEPRTGPRPRDNSSRFDD